MKMIDLNGQWSMQQVGTNEHYEAIIPGSVASTLLAHGKMEDPYLRDNEHKVQNVFYEDYVFSREFTIQANVLKHDLVLLHCCGLDTLADITVNGITVGSADNMHRTWIFDVKSLLREGVNRISILFNSPVKYLEMHPSPMGKFYTPLRKAACMFGWDWGLNLPDSGIWRDIYVEVFDAAQISHVSVVQEHHEGFVELSIEAQLEVWGENVQTAAVVKAPCGDILYTGKTPAEGSNNFHLTIENPELWWPAGYGEHPVYTVEVFLQKEGQTVDERSINIGLRTIELNRAAESDGSKYQFVVNGKKIFYRGENLIIEDSIISRSSDVHWKKLIDNSLASNLNGIRVWGGAYYPPDIFYDLCDRHGLLVYQDFMFACSFYFISEAFMDNVRHEVEDNLRRICHHACIGLYCGNNEIDGIYTVAGSNEPGTVALRKLFGADKPTPDQLALIFSMYEPLFLKLIPKMCRQYAPDTGYVHSSPSIRTPGAAESFFEYLSDGDMHYYLQYNENAPYQKMRSMHCRFMTEMGFQSYPSIKTICSFTKEMDRSPYSDIMYHHQKCFKGNETIELYMERDYIVPTDFTQYVYLSQLQAAEIMKYSIEHFRRDSGYCSGTVLWQMNDCWPVVSWSGIDYCGRWKALQYYIRRFYEPVLISALDEGSSVSLWVSNESPFAHTGMIGWQLYNNNNVVKSKKVCITSQAGSSEEYIKLDFADIINDENKGNYYLEYSFSAEGEEIGHGTVMFCLAKEFNFNIPDIRLQIAEKENCYQIAVTTSCYTKGLALDTHTGDCIFSDNWFDLSADKTKCVFVQKKDIIGITSMEGLKENLFTASLNDVMLAEGRNYV